MQVNAFAGAHPNSFQLSRPVSSTTVRSRYKRQLIRLIMKEKWPTRTGMEDSRPIFFCKRFSYNENALYCNIYFVHIRGNWLSCGKSHAARDRLGSRGRCGRFASLVHAQVGLSRTLLFATGTTAAVRCSACLFFCFLQCFYKVPGMTALLVVRRTPSTGSRTGIIGTTCL